jgi:hypothetical protein
VDKGPRKLTFEEAWDTTTSFLIDDEIEAQIEQEIQKLDEKTNHRISRGASIKVNQVAEFLMEREDNLDTILIRLGLPVERLLRIVTLLRRIGVIVGGFEREWDYKKIKRKIKGDKSFAGQIAHLLVDGKSDSTLSGSLPKFYRDMLNLREVGRESSKERRVKIKRSLLGAYGNLKGGRVEDLIKEKLKKIGVSYGSGKSRFIARDIDFAIPSTEDPQVIIMVSYQETTSSGQTTKTADMLEAYITIQKSNSRNKENRKFINFADGAGWLARSRDFERLVEQCDYFINLKNLDMLEPIIRKHVPKEYFLEPYRQ